MSYSKETLEIAEARTLQIINTANALCERAGVKDDDIKIAVASILSDQIKSIDKYSISDYEELIKNFMP